MCSECGHRFAWRDVLGPQGQPPGWSYEQGVTHSWRRLAGTLVRVVLPGRLWRGLRLTDEVRPHRLVAIVAVPLCLWHLIACAVVVASWTAFAVVNGRVRGPSPDDMLELLWPHGRFIDFPNASGVPIMGYVWWLQIPVVSMTLVMLVLGWSMRRARVRRVHLLRACAYASAAATLSGVAWAALAMLLERLMESRWGVWMWDDPWWSIYNRTYGVMMGLGIAGLAWWWWRMVDRYLRLDHAALVGLLAGAVGALVYGVVYVLVSPWQAATFFGWV